MKPVKKRAPALTPGYVGYVRVSDADVQSPERSHGYQTRLIKDVIVAGSGLSLLDIYADVDSGRNASRTAYQQLLRDARAGKFSHVAIAFVDRFSRDNLEGIRAFEELTALGIKVRIATCLSAEYETPDGAFLIGVLLGVARLESARTGQRTREGMIEKLNGGGWGWAAPDGYRNIEIRKSELEAAERAKHAFHKHDIEVNPERIEMVKLAFDLLLHEDTTLEQIAETLHARGYQRAGGAPWVSVSPDGRRTAHIKQLSRLFHNWFYAGWVVVDNEWAKIPPKTVRGTWPPAISTEDFEHGLRILEERNKDKQHQPKHFYLLQQLIYLERPNGSLVRLNCQTPNAGREGGGTAYYSLRNTNFNFPCEVVDAQLPAFLWNIQIDADCLPDIQEAYRTELVDQLGCIDEPEQRRLHNQLKQIDEAETRAARLFVDGKVTYEKFDQLAHEIREKRNAVQATLDGLDRTSEAYIASLDEALHLISRTGVLFEKLERAGQRELLLHLVKQVVVSDEGVIVRIELRPPFAYLHELAAQQGKSAPPSVSGRRRKKTSQVDDLACSSLMSACAPTGACSVS